MTPPKQPPPRWSIDELTEGIAAFAADLREAGYPEVTIQTYTEHPRKFLRYLSGEYRPTGPRGG